MTFGEKISVVRKNMKLSQNDLAKKVGTIPITIGRYERNEIKPSIDIAAKLANVLNVSLDYLVGNSDVVIEKFLVKKINEIQKLPDIDKKCVYKLLDAFLRDYKGRQTYANE